jgi:hypothetical protein
MDRRADGLQFVEVTHFGPPLPHGVLEDDGIERSIFSVIIGADLTRQFEFAKSERVDHGTWWRILLHTGAARGAVARGGRP